MNTEPSYEEPRKGNDLASRDHQPREQNTTGALADTSSPDVSTGAWRAAPSLPPRSARRRGDKWTLTTTAMSKCDVCSRSGHKVLARCTADSLAICKECYDKGRLDKDPYHFIDPAMSWTPPPKEKNKNKNKGIQARAKGKSAIFPNIKKRDVVSDGRVSKTPGLKRPRTRSVSKMEGLAALASVVDRPDTPMPRSDAGSDISDREGGTGEGSSLSTADAAKTLRELQTRPVVHNQGVPPPHMEGTAAIATHASPHILDPRVPQLATPQPQAEAGHRDVGPASYFPGFDGSHRPCDPTWHSSPGSHSHRHSLSYDVPSHHSPYAQHRHHSTALQAPAWSPHVNGYANAHSPSRSQFPPVRDLIEQTRSPPSFSRSYHHHHHHAHAPPAPPPQDQRS